MTSDVQDVSRVHAPEETVSYQPLNPHLYKALVRCFGEVQVAGEGEAFVASPAMDFGRKTYVVHSSGEYYRVCCPHCRDTRFRLWVNHRFGVYDPYTESDNRHLVICYNEDCFANPEYRQQLLLQTFGSGFRAKRDRIAVLQGTMDNAQLSPSMPPGHVDWLVDLPLNHAANLYLADRGYDPHSLAREFSLSYCYHVTDRRYEKALNRIVATVYQKGMAAGWQCRYIGELDWKRTGIPKYFTKPGMPKRLMLYNYDQAQQHDLVVVCEGISDVWSVGSYAVAILGKKIHSRQRELLASTWGKGMLVLMLDAEMYAAMEGLVPELEPLFAYGVLPIQMPGKDPGSFTREFNRNLILDAAQRRGMALPPSFLEAA